MSLIDEVENFRSRRIDGNAQEIRLLQQRVIEMMMEILAIDLDGAELAQVFCHELRIEQCEPASDQPAAEMHERDLRGITYIREHALAEEGSAQRHAVEPADKPLAFPHLNGIPCWPMNCTTLVRWLGAASKRWPISAMAIALTSIGHFH